MHLLTYAARHSFGSACDEGCALVSAAARVRCCRQGLFDSPTDTQVTGEPHGNAWLFLHAAAVLWPTPLWTCPTNCTQIPSCTLARCRRCVLCRGKVARERPRRQSCLYGTFSRGVSTEVVVLLVPVEGMATLCTKRFVSSLYDLLSVDASAAIVLDSSFSLDSPTQGLH